jgi:UDP-glucose 4-epimerase
VTGGAGYIGSVTAAALLRAGHTVTVYDNLSGGYRAAVPRAARFVHGDIHDRAALDALLGAAAVAAPFEAILHFAAYIEAGESMQDPTRYFYNNTAGTLSLMRAALAHGVARFVFSSTAAIFAGGAAPIAEDDPQVPANVYGHSKLMIEQMLAWCGQIHGLRYACLRYFNASGASDGRGEAHQPETHLIPLVLQVALGQRQAIQIFGTDYPTPDGTCIRDYIHIADLAQAHVLALEALDTRTRLAYNLGNGAGYSVRQVMEVARAVTGHPLPAVEAPRRVGDAPRLVASSVAIQRELGWAPRYADLHTIVASAWEWHQAHPHGYAHAPRH